MSRFYLALFLVLGFISAQAQKEENDNYGYIPELRVSVLSPIALLDLKPFMEASVEKKMYKRNALEFALGVYLPNHISDYDPLGNEEDISRAGFRLRVNWKWFDKQFKSRPHYNSYISPELLFNYHTFKSSDWYDRFEDAYQEYLTTTSRTTSLGIGFKIGEQYFTKNNKFYIDQFMGLGLRLQHISFKNAPEDITTGSNGGAIGRPAGTYYFPYIVLGLKLGIVLKK